MDNRINVKIKRLRPGAVLPAYESADAAALDLRACVDSPLTIPARGRALVPTGIAIEPEGCGAVAVVCARSGLSSKKGIALANGIGVVDADYRGEILVSAINNSDTDYTVENGERIAQMMFLPVLHADITESDTLTETKRGAGGFGSTGKK